jgi:hypothetical protein
MNEQVEPSPEKWPSILPSYHLLTSRFEAADSRIVSLITMASSVTFAAPILARSVRPDLSLSSPWFVSALVVFGVIVVGGLVARIKGVLTLPNPGVIYETALTKPDWRFKADAIYFSGQHFDANARAINAKGNWSIGLTALVVIEVVLMMAWMAQ